MSVSSTSVSGLNIFYHNNNYIYPLYIPSGLKIDGCHEGIF